MQAKTRLSKKIVRKFSKKLICIYVTRHSTEKWRDIMGICYTLFLDARNYGAHGSTLEPRDWHVA